MHTVVYEPTTRVAKKLEASEREPPANLHASLHDIGVSKMFIPPLISMLDFKPEREILSNDTQYRNPR